ncbi:heparin lyase I family protein [Streptomyces physcomitrii]|uniref:Uncharacterized protein n=1 Tax=Streptomyces physcomitrii TaxID=2724184 RepID=A0ABX1H4I7_9ACTN|nr:heparin lyase I family protein [Streptomyces physcomitrii]NKI42169.1 hypothetical protein [Streptomyces physcomitrii]
MTHPQSFSRRRILRYSLLSALAVPAAALGGEVAVAGARDPGRAAPLDEVPPFDVQWSTDFSNGWEGWLDTPWNDEPQGEVARPAVVDSPTGEGSSGRFRLEGGQQRNESQPDAAQQITEGQTLVVRFTDFLEEGFPVDTDDWQVVLQFKNEGTGSPPCEIKIGGGQYLLDGDSGGWHHEIGPAVTGQPVDIAVRITFSEDPAKSAIDAWYNGEQTLSGVFPEGAGTLYPGLSSYLKTGLYRSPGIQEAGTRHLTRLLIGTPAD